MIVSLSVCFWQSKRCGFLAGKGHLGSQPLPQLRKLPKELMELVLLLLSQVFFFLIFHYLGVLWFAFILIQEFVVSDCCKSHSGIRSVCVVGLGINGWKTVFLFCRCWCCSFIGISLLSNGFSVIYKKVD